MAFRCAVSVGLVRSLVMYGYTLAPHCKFRGISACHINRGSKLTLNVSFLALLSQQGSKTHLDFMER